MNTTPKTLNVTETHQLLDSLMPKEGTHRQFKRNVRNYTLACLMLEAGLRVGEAVQLRWADLYFNSVPVTSITVRAEIAKNHKEREIPVSTRLSEALKGHWQYNRPPISEFGQAFCFYRTDPSSHITTRQAERIIERAARVTLGKPVHPHMLRHTFGSKLMRKAPASVVQELLGHKHLSSTQVYTHPNADDKRKAIADADDHQLPPFRPLPPGHLPCDDCPRSDKCDRTYFYADHKTGALRCDAKPQPPAARALAP